MFSIDLYLKQLTGSLLDVFGDRLLYIGLQGSFRRGEAKNNSDIDIMTVLDDLTVADLYTYRQTVQAIESPHPTCGFICGKAELLCWNPCEICQVAHETKDIYGALAPLLPTYTKEDVRRGVQAGVGDLYHAICHSVVHAKGCADTATLAAAYKTAFYLLQNLIFLKTGVFCLTKGELTQAVDGMDREILQTDPQENPDAAFSLLFDWCKATLQQLGRKEI